MKPIRVIEDSSVKGVATYPMVDIEAFQPLEAPKKILAYLPLSGDANSPFKNETHSPPWLILAGHAKGAYSSAQGPKRAGQRN